MPHRDLMNPYRSGRAGPVRRGWALPLVAAGAGVAAVVAGAGAAHAEPDSGAGGSGEVEFDDDAVAAGESFVDATGIGSWGESSTADAEDGDAPVSLPPLIETSASPDPERPAPERLLLPQTESEPSGPDAGSWVGVDAAAGPWTESISLALDGLLEPVDARTGSDRSADLEPEVPEFLAQADLADAPRTLTPSNPASSPSLDSTQVTDPVTIPAAGVLPTDRVPFGSTAVDAFLNSATALDPDASPALLSVAPEPFPPTGDAEPVTVGTGTSFSGRTSTQDTMALDIALDAGQRSRTTTGSTTAATTAVLASGPYGHEPDLGGSAGDEEQVPDDPPRAGEEDGLTWWTLDQNNIGGYAQDGTAGGGTVLAPGPPGSVDPAQRSSAGSGPLVRSIRIRAGDDPADVSLAGPEQGAMTASLFTEEGQRRLRSMLSTEQVLDPDGSDPDGSDRTRQLDLFVARTAEQLRQLAINSDPLTRERASDFYPVPAPEDSITATLPEEMKSTFQQYHDKVNTELAERAMAGLWGFEAPELACWLVCYRDGTSRVLPDLYVGGNGHVGGTEATVHGLDLSDVTDVVSIHTHPLFVRTDPPYSYNTTGLSAGDVEFLDTMGALLAPHVRAGVASVSLLEGTVTIGRRDPDPGGTSGAEADPTGGPGPLIVRVLPSSPGSPVTDDIKIQVDDRGTVDYSLATVMEAPGVSDRRYAAVQRAVEEPLTGTALTAPPDLYGPVVDPPDPMPLGRRGLLVRPPASRDLPFPTDAPHPSVDPGVDGEDTSPSSPLPGSALPDGDGSTTSGGVVVAPELPGYDPQLDPNAANMIPQERSQRLDDAPDDHPIDPDEFDPNRVPDPVPVDPDESVGETFPDRDEELEQILAPTGVPGLFTFPLSAEEPPVAPSVPVQEPVAPSPVRDAMRGGAPPSPLTLRPDSRYPLCGSGVPDGCVDPSSLYDHDDDGVADNAGLLLDGLAGEATVGPLIVGPLLVGAGSTESSPIELAPIEPSPIEPSPALAPQPTTLADTRLDRNPAPAPPTPAASPESGMTWQERAGQVGEAVWHVITTPHPLDPVRGAWRDVWRYVPGIPVPGEGRQFAP
ncbi:MAG: hypothetical protein LH603_12055 [Pseudonocardia sp.]|nr:hypothetical protein [Pseudonocardia sp.]